MKKALIPVPTISWLCFIVIIFCLGLLLLIGEIGTLMFWFNLLVTIAPLVFAFLIALRLTAKKEKNKSIIWLTSFTGASIVSLIIFLNKLTEINKWINNILDIISYVAMGVILVCSLILAIRSSRKEKRW